MDRKKAYVEWTVLIKIDVLKELTLDTYLDLTSDYFRATSQGFVEVS